MHRCLPYAFHTCRVRRAAVASRHGAFDKLASKYYNSFVTKISEKLMQQARQELARQGGKARAAKYDKDTLSKWAKKGGRPRKKA